MSKESIQGVMITRTWRRWRDLGDVLLSKSRGGMRGFRVLAPEDGMRVLASFPKQSSIRHLTSKCRIPLPQTTNCFIGCRRVMYALTRVIGRWVLCAISSRRISGGIKQNAWLSAEKVPPAFVSNRTIRVCRYPIIC